MSAIKTFFSTFSRSQYNIKKKEEIVEQAPPEPDNPLMRKKKTPEELAAEAEAEDLDDFTSEYFDFIRFTRIFGTFYPTLQILLQTEQPHHHCSNRLNMSKPIIVCVCNNNHHEISIIGS